LRYIQKKNFDKQISEKDKSNIAASFQKAATQAIIQKVNLALDENKINSLSLVGGVAANKKLRNEFYKIGQHKNIKIVIPKIEYCGDNAAMIAYRGMQYYKAGKTYTLSSNAYPGLPTDVFLRRTENNLKTDN